MAQLMILLSLEESVKRKNQAFCQGHSYIYIYKYLFTYIFTNYCCYVIEKNWTSEEFYTALSSLSPLNITLCSKLKGNLRSAPSSLQGLPSWTEYKEEPVSQATIRTAPASTRRRCSLLKQIPIWVDRIKAWESTAVYVSKGSPNSYYLGS